MKRSKELIGLKKEVERLARFRVIDIDDANIYFVIPEKVDGKVVNTEQRIHIGDVLNFYKFVWWNEKLEDSDKVMIGCLIDLTKKEAKELADLLLAYFGRVNEGELVRISNAKGMRVEKEAEDIVLYPPKEVK